MTLVARADDEESACLMQGVRLHYRLDGLIPQICLGVARGLAIGQLRRGHTPVVSGTQPSGNPVIAVLASDVPDEN